MSLRQSALLFALPAAAAAAGAASPDALVASLQRAADHGDIDAASRLIDLAHAPASARFFYLSTVSECAEEMTCKVARGPLDAELRASLDQEAEALDMQVPSIDGVLRIESTSRDGSGSGTMRMPYGKLDGGYVLVSLRPSAEQLQRMHARSNESLLAELFDDGIYDDASGEHRKDWASIAKPLPADGGDAGRALLAQTRAMAAAVDAKNPDAAVRDGGQMARLIYADKDYTGKPVPLAQRQRKLELQGLRMLRDVEVRGGYSHGNDAALLVDARNGIGWIERGAVLMTQRDGEWSVSGRKTVSYPDPAKP